MLVKFWGVRGSIPKPGSETLKYGGNTSCVQCTSDAGEMLIIDAGTGAYNLGMFLLSQNKEFYKGSICLSHTHWDHIQGLPFFAPFSNPRNEWDIYGPYGFGQSIEQSLKGQMLHQYFPISLKEFEAKISYHDLLEGEFMIGGMRVKTHYLNHTALTLGFRIEVDGVVVIYACDHEPFAKNLAGGEGTIGGQDLRHIEFLRGADLLIHDSQYSVSEYSNKIGWGHSTPEYVIRIAKEAGIKNVVLTHHDPLRSDEDLDRLNRRIHEKLTLDGSSMKVLLAYEGLEINVVPDNNPANQSNSQTVSEEPILQETLSISTIEHISKSALVGTSVFIFCKTPSHIALLQEALEKEEIPCDIVTSVESAVAKMKERKPALLIVEHAPPVMDGIAIAQSICNEASTHELRIPIMLVTAEVIDSVLGKWGIIDSICPPFTLSYARSKISAWLFRLPFDWKNASLSSNEEEARLEDLDALHILDSPREQKFDRIVEIAAELFNVPIAAIGLIDKDRQWFKSSIGLETTEIAREISFCNHVVSSRNPVIVYDSLQDERFVDNPVIGANLKVRFYAGYPIILKSGSVIGSLFIMDTRPRYISKEKLLLLEYLRDLTVKELSFSRN